MNIAPEICFHMLNAEHYIGMYDEQTKKPLLGCPFCIASKLRSNLSGSTPSQLTTDLYLDDCDSDCVKTLIGELLSQIDSLKVGHSQHKFREKAVSSRFSIEQRTRSTL